MPCSNARARILIRKGRAKVYRLFPFTIQLLDRASSDVQPVAIKFDPGANTTGVAIVREDPKDPTRQTVLHLAEIAHRGQTIRKRMIQRAMFRRRRRTANLRYRAPKFANRTRREDWLPPSLQSRVDNVTSWLNRYRKLAPITAIKVESIRFDMQALERPDIEAWSTSGVRCSARNSGNTSLRNGGEDARTAMRKAFRLRRNTSCPRPVADQPEPAT